MCAGISRRIYRVPIAAAECAMRLDAKYSSPRSGRLGADRAMERRRDEEGAVSLGRGSACLPLDLLLRRQAGNDLGLKGGKPRRLDVGSDRDQLRHKRSDW